MTFRAIFYDRHGHVSPSTRAVSAADADHLPDIILVVPGRITYDRHGTTPRAGTSTANAPVGVAAGSQPEDSLR